MKRVELYLSVFFSFMVIAYFAMCMVRINAISSKSDFSFSIPKLKLINPSIPKSSYISNPIVWNVKISPESAPKASELRKTKGSKEQQIKRGFKYEELNGIPTVYDTTNSNYKWEFFGVIYSNGKKEAIFYNPSLKGENLRLVEKKGSIDAYLMLEDVKGDTVTVKCIGCKDKKTFVFSIFSIKGVDK